MQEYKAIISEGGRISLPASLREKLFLKVGQEVIMQLHGDEIHMFSLAKAVKRAQEMVRKYNPTKKSLTKALFDMRREDNS